jgi:hypothetical protein
MLVAKGAAISRVRKAVSAGSDLPGFVLSYVYRQRQLEAEDDIVLTYSLRRETFVRVVAGQQ